MAAEHGLHISLPAEPVFHIGPLAITNTIIMGWVVVCMVVIISVLLQRTRFQKIPNRLQNFFELVMDGVLMFMDTVTGSRVLSRRFLPLCLSIFVFVILSNWLGILPGMGTLIVNGVHIVRAPSADLNFTFALATVSVIATHVFGVVALGIKSHAKKFFSLHPIKGFVGILEVVSEFSKVVSLSFRLFGNVFAGELLLLVIGFLMPYVLPLPFLFLEIFVGFVQALVFSMLTLVFATMSVHSHDEAH